MLEQNCVLRIDAIEPSKPCWQAVTFTLQLCFLKSFPALEEGCRVSGTRVRVDEPPVKRAGPYAILGAAKLGIG